MKTGKIGEYENREGKVYKWNVTMTKSYITSDLEIIWVKNISEIY